MREQDVSDVRPEEIPAPALDAQEVVADHPGDLAPPLPAIGPGGIVPENESSIDEPEAPSQAIPSPQTRAALAEAVREAAAFLVQFWREGLLPYPGKGLARELDLTAALRPFVAEITSEIALTLPRPASAAAQRPGRIRPSTAQPRPCTWERSSSSIPARFTPWPTGCSSGMWPSGPHCR